MDGIVARVAEDGLFEVRFVDVRRAVLASVQASSSGGILQARFPAEMPKGVGYVQIARPGEAPLATAAFARY